MKKLPLAKNNDIIVQSAGSELLVYDLNTNIAYNLNETSTKIFNACDGKTSFDDLKRKHKFTDEIIYFALDELKKNNLLKGDYDSPFVGMNRRDVVRQIGLASLTALPVILSLVTPSAAQAISCVNPRGFPRGSLVSGFPVQPDCPTCLNYGKQQCCSGNAALVVCPNVPGGGVACTVQCQ